MDDRRAALAFRGLRVRRRWRQKDLGARAGVSRQFVTKIESGRIDTIDLRRLRLVADALGATVELLVRAPGGEIDRTVNAAHAAMHEAVARLFRTRQTWSTAPEVTFSIYGERGVIDVLAWHAATRSLLVVELKTLLVDINDLMGSMDRRRRLAIRIARDRGWLPRHVGVWVAVADTSTNHRRLADHSTVLRTAFPNDGRALRGWLGRPAGPIAALSFLSAATRGGRRADFRPARQVRKPAADQFTHGDRSVPTVPKPRPSLRP